MANQCANKSYQKASIVKGRHVCKVIWTAEVGEELPVNCEYGNEHDEPTVAVLKDYEIVCHLPCTILYVSWFFLRRRHSKCAYYHMDIVPYPQCLLETLRLFGILWAYTRHLLETNM